MKKQDKRKCLCHDGLFWPVAEPSVYLARLQIANAKFRQITRIALIYLLERQIILLHFVIAGLHVFAVLGRRDGNRAIFPNSQAKLPRCGFVVGNEEAVPHAGAIHAVQCDHAMFRWLENRGQHTRPRRQGPRNLLGVVFQAVKQSRIAIN